nr:hypothetical protein [Pseudomonadota bacterium]
MPKSISHSRGLVAKIFFLVFCFCYIHSASADNYLSNDNSPGNKYVKASLIIDKSNLQSNSTEKTNVATLGI